MTYPPLSWVVYVHVIPPRVDSTSTQILVKNDYDANIPLENDRLIIPIKRRLTCSMKSIRSLKGISHKYERRSKGSIRILTVG